MPPPAKKDIQLFIFDLKSANKHQLLEVFLKLATHKMVIEKDLCHVLLANSAETSNLKNVQNIFETGIHNFDPEKFHNCAVNTQSSDEDVDICDTLLLGLHYIHRTRDLRGIVNIQIVFLTDLTHQKCEKNSTKMPLIIERLNKSKIGLYIVGPEVHFQEMISNPYDPECKKKILGDDSNPAFVAAREIVRNTHRSIICDAKIGINMVMFYRDAAGSQPWTVPLSIGTSLNIKAKTSKIYNSTTNFKLKGHSNQHLSSQIYVLSSDPNEERSVEDLVRGMLFHGKFIKIDDEDMFKFETERSFDLVGFTSRKFISEAYIGSEGTFHVLPGDTIDDGQYELFTRLVHVLAKDDKCAIVQRVYNKNNNPRFFVLRPEPNASPCRFVMTDLPYADDITGKYQKISIPEPIDKKSEDEKSEDDFTRFCQSLDVHHDRCCIDVPVAPTMMLEYFTNNAVTKTAEKICNKTKKSVEFKNNEFCDFNAPWSNGYAEELKKSWPESIFQ